MRALSTFKKCGNDIKLKPEVHSPVLTFIDRQSMTTCVALLENIKTPKITNIQFGLLNPAIVRRQSVVHVTKNSLYVRQMPAPGGLNDLRMGTSDRRLPCGTCKNDVLSCVGHPGHIDLAAPVYHVSMINIVLKILRCVCFFCSHLLVTPETDTRFQDERFKTSDPKDRLGLMVNLCKTRHFCVYCLGPQPKYTQIRSIAQIKTEFRAKDAEQFENELEREFVALPFNAALARDILKFISDDDVKLLGINPLFSRPEWLILTVLQVPPPISRPSIMATDGSRARGQDDITLKLQDVVKANSVLLQALKTAGLVKTAAPSEAGSGVSSVSVSNASGSSTRVSKSEVSKPVDVLGSSGVYENDFTALYMSAVSLAVKTAWDALQLHLVQFMHHDASGTSPAGSGGGAAQRNSRPLRLIPGRLKGKKGRFRGTLGGKRVDYSARTVVSPAPTYDIHEVGVPQIIAQHLTFPERVNSLNINELSARVKRGPRHPQGASAVVMPDGSLIDLTLHDAMNGDMELEVGWVVERFLKDGDWVLFNRQPSLHRMSIMAHQVRIIQDKTFRLPVCDTTPYNADFDGDEMNLHVLRTVEAVAEAQLLMSVKTQIMSPQSNKPIIGLVQDSLVSVFLLTQRETFLTRAQIMQMVMPIKYPLFTLLPQPAILKPIPLWTGKQLFSLLFPVFSLSMVVRSGTADGVHVHTEGSLDVLERCVVISKGELCAGSLCKKTMGTSAGGIIHLLVKDFDNETAARFIGDAQRVLVEFMQLRGFSVGVGDCLMQTDMHEQVNASIDRCLVYGDKIIQNAKAGETSSLLMEGCMTKLMTGVLNRAGAVVQKDLSPQNNVLIMVQSGAKGSPVNIAQILACVGQQSVEGGRISRDVDNRTLPCYPVGDTTAESRGFVANSYGTGLTAQEYFFHAMGGREGLVDTAVKTASTGYIQRRLVKSEEGLQVRYDHSVRNTKDHIVQFYYGGDCFDAVAVEKQTLCTFSMSDEQLRSEYWFSPLALSDAQSEGRGETNDTSSFNQWEDALEVEYRQLKEDRDCIRSAKIRLHNVPDSTVFVTVSALRMLESTVTRFGIKRNARTDILLPSDVTRVVHAAFAEIGGMRRHTATLVTLAYLRSVFCLKSIVTVHRLSMEALVWCMGKVVCKYRESLTSPGEMVGTLGAASIGEPCTQMTLNTFHTAGVAAKTVTLGVPRLKELIDTSRNIKTPSATIFFDKAYSANEKMALTFGSGLQHTMLNQVVETSSVHFDPELWSTVIVEDKPIVDAYRRLFFDDHDSVLGEEVVTPGLQRCSSTTHGRHSARGTDGVSCAHNAVRSGYPGNGEDAGSVGGASFEVKSKVEADSHTRWVIRFVLDRRFLASRNLHVQHVAEAMQAYMGDSAQITCSEVNMVHWCIRLRVQNIPVLIDELSSDTDAEERSGLEYASMKTIHDFLVDNMPIHGVPGVTRVVVHKQACVRIGENNELIQVQEWMGDTDGTNLRALLSIPHVDQKRTISNDIHEVLDVLGIEAAQQVLIDEIRAVLSFDGAYVNDRHLQLLVDVMTLSGTLTAMTRHSMHKLGGSTYHHASFEETQDVLINAAAFGVHDRISGVTENIMIGMLMPGGTGCCDIISTLKEEKELVQSCTGIVKPLVLPVSNSSSMVVKPLELVAAVPTIVKPLVLSGQGGAVASDEVGAETAATTRVFSTGFELFVKARRGKQKQVSSQGEQGSSVNHEYKMGIRVSKKGAKVLDVEKTGNRCTRRSQGRGSGLERSVIGTLAAHEKIATNDGETAVGPTLRPEEVQLKFTVLGPGPTVNKEMRSGVTVDDGTMDDREGVTSLPLSRKRVRMDEVVDDKNCDGKVVSCVGESTERSTTGKERENACAVTGNGSVRCRQTSVEQVNRARASSGFETVVPVFTPLSPLNILKAKEFRSLSPARF